MRLSKTSRTSQLTTFGILPIASITVLFCPFVEKLNWLKSTVGAFYENVYAPVLQTLPWIDAEDGLKTASEKVLGNLAFPAYELSFYKNQSDKNLIEHLRARRGELESIYQKMQDELRPLLAKMPVKDQTWEKLQEMVPKWKNLSSSDLLPYNIHKAVEEFYASSNPIQSSEMTGGSATSPDVSTFVLGELIADKIKSLHKKGENDHTVALALGTHGFWLDRGFVNRLRYMPGNF